MIFGIDVKMNEHWTARVGVDLIRMTTLYLKPAVITYQKGRWTVDSGIFFTSELDKTMPQLWNNRFIEKVAADKWLYSPTCDLGLRVTYQWNSFITTDFSIVSGNGYQRLLEKYHPKPAFRLILTPVGSLQIGSYFSVRKEESVVETTFNSFVHLQPGDKWKATGEYHHRTNHRFAENHKMDVVSVYGTYHLLPWLALMGRYDFVKSNSVHATGERWNELEDGNAVIGGLIFKCFPSMRLSVNYWNKRPPVKHIKKEDWLYFCVEFKY